ncbi:TPA: FadR family transcriptional regulator, partial [Enterococcus faecium]
HTEIVQAIERRNALAAFDAMTVHMAINRRELQKIIGEKETN